MSTNNPASAQVVTIGKVPGTLHEVPIEGKKKICALFIEIGIKEGDLGSCEVQKNGVSAGVNEYAEAGDTILAVAKIRGN